MSGSSPWLRRVARPLAVATLVALVIVLVVAATVSARDASSSRGHLQVAEGPNSVLTGVVDIELDEPAQFRVEAVADDHRVTSPWTREPTDDLSLDLVGLRAERTYRITVDARAEDGVTVARATTEFTTGPLPDVLPEMDVAAADGTRMAPGLTMFDAGSWQTEGGRGRVDPVLLMVDDEGEVVWYHQDFFTIGDATLTERGTIVYNNPPFGVREIDLMGRDVGRWEIGPSENEATTALFPQAPNLGRMHHVARPLPNGNIIGLGSREILLTDADRQAICPDGYGAPFDLTDNTIMEFNREGEIVNEWAVSDLVDPVDHPGTDLCGPKGGLRDWSHTNAAVVDADQNAVIVSSRNLDLVFAFRYEADEAGPSGEVLWSLGTGGSLDVTEGDQPYHQHAPEPGEDGSMLIYDNGNGRPGYSARDRENPTYSRAVLYDLDLEAGTARQLWEHRIDDLDGEPLFAAFLGDADRLPNGNVLIDHGGIDRYQPPAHGRIIEVVPEGEAGGDVVFDLRLPGPWVSYRAERLPSLWTDPIWGPPAEP